MHNIFQSPPSNLKLQNISVLLQAMNDRAPNISKLKMSSKTTHKVHHT